MIRKIEKIKVEDVYVSVLTAQLVTNSDGSMRWVEQPHDLRPSGSVVVDAVVSVLLERRYRMLKDIAKLLEVDSTELNKAMQLLTGYGVQEFATQYFLLAAQEYLRCTDLPLKEIARRCGHGQMSAMTGYFQRILQITPQEYRRKNRPADYRFLYRWK